MAEDLPHWSVYYANSALEAVEKSEKATGVDTMEAAICAAQGQVYATLCLAAVTQEESRNA